MARIDNPRFPHTCVIKRAAKTGPMEDQPQPTNPYDDDPMQDDPMLDDPMLDDDPMNDENDPLFDDADEPTPETPPFNEDGATVIYDGVCRDSGKYQTNYHGRVVTSARHVSIPMTRSDWKKLGVCPQYGDQIFVSKDGVQIESGQVKDCQPGNIGTTLLFEYFPSGSKSSEGGE